MIWEITKKEIRINFLTFKFYISFILLFIVVIISSVVLATNYNRKLSEYQARVIGNDRILDNYATMNRIQNSVKAIKPPTKMSSLFQGISDDLLIESFEDDPTRILFPIVDWIFIIGVIGSLLVVFLSYDSITGEKETGTLQLLLSHPLPKARLLLGKLLGGLFSIIPPFIIAVLAGLLVVIVIAKPQWGSEDYLALGYITFASLLFFTVIFLIGLIISSKVQSSATAVFAHLLSWVILVLIIPNLSPFISTVIYPIPSADMISNQLYHLMNIEREAVISREVNKYQNSGLTESEIFKKIGFDEIQESYRAKANRIQESYINQVMAQTLIAMNIAAISPYAQFLYVATDASRAGVVNTINYLETEDMYLNRMNAFVQKKYKEAVKISSNFSIDDKLDLTERPRFNYTELGLAPRIMYTIPYLLLLIIYNAVALLLSYRAFRRTAIV